ncbi:phosphoheptose isomerase [Actinomadura sp. HBU206391]|uniref:phosphoheptose isomerase n=1 Tax=Actinomadura sp. HBU206391 TaxID=2731692 RepID=UPI0016508CB2|nr:phosphoheptose isomerase [Actinomadura sp. HBU206391]MBC6462284.1 phosphoheptose isomerase [Actinomadura sp. HBU206391]
MSGFDVLTRGEVLDTALKAREYLITCGVPAALAAKDPRLWGRRAVDHSRLGWLDLPESSQALLTQLEDLVAEVRYSGFDHIVLVGLGSEGLAAQAIIDAGGGTDPRGDLTLLDGGDAGALDVVLKRLDRTLVVLSSKAGVSIEGDAYRRVLVQAFREHGLSDQEIAGRFVVITDHGSPLSDFATERGYRVGLTDPYLPGHFGALSAYGLVPAVLAGTDVAPLLDQAAAASDSLAREEDNPGLLLGAVLGGCALPPPGGVVRDKLVLREPGGGSALTGWVSQLLATGTGKRGRGILPLDPTGLPGTEDCPDLHGIAVNPQSPATTDADTSLWAPLGAQFLLWEYATAVAGWLMGVNPFESADEVIQETEDDAATMLRSTGHGPLPTGQASFVDGGIEVYTDSAGFGSYNLAGAVEALLRRVPATGYLSILTYLSGDFSGRYLAPALARRIRRPVTYGSGPGYLHGTGSFHKDGPRNGAFLVVTGAGMADHAVPGRPYTLGKLHLARALADVRALRRRGIPVVRLHLRDPIEGAGRLIDIARETR